MTAPRERRAERQLMIMVNGFRNERRKRVEIEAERDELREALRKLIVLKRAEDGGVFVHFPNFARDKNAAWKRVVELISIEDET